MKRMASLLGMAVLAASVTVALAESRPLGAAARRRRGRGWRSLVAEGGGRSGGRGTAAGSAGRTG